jgi:rSAM/selenodomain-associated transferase 1
LWCSPDNRHDFFQACVENYGVSLHPQQGADLGERMYNSFTHALKQFGNVLIVGCDCPSLTEQDFSQAITALNNDYDVVLAPAEDGGYTLIGLNRIQPELFSQINWGSSEVLASTRNKIAKLKLNYLELGEQWDVDTPDDLARYYNQVLQ